MSEMYSFCGLNCTSCPAYITKQTNDNELRKKTAKRWSSHLKLKAEDINCDGCESLDGIHIPFCRKCIVRKCVLERNIGGCAYCNDYPCDILETLWKWLRSPQAKKNLNKIRSSYIESLFT